MKLNKEHKCHGGKLGYYSHDSRETNTLMNFSLFLPSEDKKTGAYVIFLSGLVCTEDNFTTKANAYKKAAELGLAVLVPDTSPRGEDVPNDKNYALGQGAGFYIDATQAPWDKNFRMESYILKELVPQCEKHFNLDPTQKSIMGHSMGGHGALSLYFKYPKTFKSCSAFAPIVAPTQVSWGQEIFTAYLGHDKNEWKQHDATHLVGQAKNPQTNAPILIDQGLADEFLEKNLQPHLFKKACDDVRQQLTLRHHEGYDHSYFFIQSFIDDHLEWHTNN